MLFGAHCSGGIKKALDNAVAMGAEAVQLFVQSPRTWRFPNHDPDDLARFRDRREETGLPVTDPVRFDAAPLVEAILQGAMAVQ